MNLECNLLSTWCLLKSTLILFHLSNVIYHDVIFSATHCVISLFLFLTPEKIYCYLKKQLLFIISLKTPSAITPFHHRNYHATARIFFATTNINFVTKKNINTKPTSETTFKQQPLPKQPPPSWQIWQKVKLSNPGMTVCEVGTAIGQMWREMSDSDKQAYNVDFAIDKVLPLLLWG